MASRGRASALVVLCSVLVLAPHAAAKKPLVSAMFVFGDSLLDVGNNNHLANCNISCQANYPRYGIDLPCHKPTGRFSNGYNLADQLAQMLGFAESPPPFLSLLKSNASVFTGINFASGGSGLLPTTGPQVCGQVFPMSEQVGNFTSLVGRMSGSGDWTAAAAALDLISESLFFISAGSNDLFEYADFAVTHPSTSRNDTEFLQRLIASYTGYIKDLYAAGATRFSVLSPSLVGCCPHQRRVAKDFGDVDQRGCLGTANNLSRQLYPMIDSMLQDLRQELPGMKYSLGDGIRMGEFVFNNANFKLDHACCGEGEFGESLCNSTVPLCQNRRSYFFWDRFHPTDAASAITATGLFSDTGRFVHPINVRQLVAQRS